MKQRPIGVFDSGVGGLSAMKEIIKLMPNENIVYFGDTARVPYGNKSPKTIVKYAKENIEFLKTQNIKIIIVACGTMSVQLENFISCADGIPTFGILEPTCLAAVKKTRNGIIGVIGTNATVKSFAYSKLLHQIDNSVKIFQKSCQLFVPLVENNFIDENDEILKLAIKRYLSDFKQLNIDTLILGCTHFSIIRKAISNFFGPNVVLVNSGAEIAKFAKNELFKLNLHNQNKTNGIQNYFVSDSVENFLAISSVFLGKNISENSIKLV